MHDGQDKQNKQKTSQRKCNLPTAFSRGLPVLLVLYALYVLPVLAILLVLLSTLQRSLFNLNSF